jgi:hypothetical protein
MPTKTGRYIGTAIQTAVEQKPNKCPQWVAIFRLTSWFNGTDWEPVNGDITMTGYFTLVNSDGAFNLNLMRTDGSAGFIAQAFGLDWLDFQYLATADFTGIEIQIDVEDEEYNGKTSRKVTGIYSRDYAGREIKTDPVVVTSLQAKYGALLKQHKPKTAPKPTTPAATGPVDHKVAAWKEFIAKTPAMNADDRKAAWLETVQGYAGCGVKDVANWQHVANSIAEHGPWKAPEASASQGGPGIPEDDEQIPF